MILVSTKRKTKGLISCAVTAQLICVFVFAYAFCLFSCAAAHFFKVFISKVKIERPGINAIINEVKIVSRDSVPSLCCSFIHSYEAFVMF